MTEVKRALIRGLGPWAAASLVVGTIIGTGVFLKTAVMAQLGGSPAWVLAAWGVAGILSFTGAMSYAELGGMFPAAGGEYIYLRQGYGPFMGYLFAWNRFWIATPGRSPRTPSVARRLGPCCPSRSPVQVRRAASSRVNASTRNVRSAGAADGADVLKVIMIRDRAGALTARRWPRSTAASGPA
jgi:hypothetical protein